MLDSDDVPSLRLSGHGMGCRMAGHFTGKGGLRKLDRPGAYRGMISRSLLLAPTLSTRLSSAGYKLEGIMDPASKRTEDRTPMKVNVDLSSLDVRLPAQEGITENISPRGARILTTKPWKPNDRLNLRSLSGNFRSRARVVYCVPVDGSQFALGLQLFAAAGNWRSPN